MFTPKGVPRVGRTVTHSFRCGLITFVPPGGTCLPRSGTNKLHRIPENQAGRVTNITRPRLRTSAHNRAICITLKGVLRLGRTFTHSFRCGLISFVPRAGLASCAGRTRNLNRSPENQAGLVIDITCRRLRTLAHNRAICVTPEGVLRTKRTVTHSFRCGLISFVPPGGTSFLRGAGLASCAAGLAT